MAIKCPNCGVEFVPERDVPMNKIVESLYEKHPSIKALEQPMNSESFTYNYPALGVFDCVDGT